MLPFTYGGRGSGSNSRTYFRVRIAAGGSHSLFVQAGLVWAWGKNDEGQLGDTSQNDRLSPSFVIGLNNIKAVSAGSSHSLALQTGGRVWAWGDNSKGQLGIGPKPVLSTKPMLVKTIETGNSTSSLNIKASSDTSNSKMFRPGILKKREKVVPLENIIAISAGDEHNLALDASGQVWAWGANQDGQLGIGHQRTHYYAIKVQNESGANFSFLHKIITIAAGSNHSLAATSDGKTFAWGGGSLGQLGDSKRLSSSLPVQVKENSGKSLEGVVVVAAGLQYSMALTSDMRVFTWGDDKANTGASATAQALSFSWDSFPVDITAGTSHSLVLTRKGKVYAWGQNIYGEAGNGKRGEFRLEKPVITSTEDMLAIAAGNGHSLAMKIDSSLWAWGKNDSGQLGAFSRQQVELQPKRVLQKSQNLIATGTSHSLAIKGGTVWSWGDGGPKLGYRGSFSAKNDIPLRIERAAPTTRAKKDLQDVVSVAAGSSHSIALRVDGEVLAWGRFTFGQIRSAMVPGLDSNFIAIAAGHFHSLALRADGSVWDWSRNTSRLGAIQYGHSISGLPRITAISANAGHSLALAFDGTVWSWGTGYLGDGKSFGRREQPKQVLISENNPLKDIVELSTGPLHSMVVDKDGNVWTWGNNGAKALGRGGDPLFAGKIEPFGRVVRVAAGLRHSLALQDDGSIWVWGTNAEGQFGNRQVAKIPNRKPTKITALKNVIAISTSNKHSLALGSNKDVVSWGEDLHGELGRRLQGIKHLSPNVTFNISIAISISYGNEFHLALKENGTATTWGKNYIGQLGNGQTSLHSITTPTNVFVSKNQILENIISISAGPQSSLAVRLDGTVFVWGGANWLVFAKKDVNTSFATKAIPVAGSRLKSIDNVVSATIRGQNRIIILKEDGTVWGWGHNYRGALGYSSCTFSRDSPCKPNGIIEPVQIHIRGNQETPLRDIVAIISGADSNLNAAITSHATSYLWGRQFLPEWPGAVVFMRENQRQAITDIIASAGGYHFVPFLLSTGRVLLGTENKSRWKLKIPLESELNNVQAIYSSSFVLCAMNAKGFLSAWKMNAIGSGFDFSKISQSPSNSNITSVSLEGSSNSTAVNVAALANNGQIYLGNTASLERGFKPSIYP